MSIEVKPPVTKDTNLSSPDGERLGWPTCVSDDVSTLHFTIIRDGKLWPDRRSGMYPDGRLRSDGSPLASVVRGAHHAH